MNSKLVGNEEAATQSESFKTQQIKKKESQVRSLYSNPTTARNIPAFHTAKSKKREIAEGSRPRKILQTIKTAPFELSMLVLWKN
jgi:hypothetical protein